MKVSNFFISTIKNIKNNTKINSYKLMLKSGIIKKISTGIYTYMPIGLRIIKKIKNIIREEMQKSGSIELLMPIIQPSKLWEKSGRLNTMGLELVRFNDRNNKKYVIQPTSEELITNIVKSEIKSYKQLPINFFHIQVKFRDELRPKLGLLRSREFLMKDSYSFDKNKNELLKSYNNMYNTYIRIFNRINLNFKIVLTNNENLEGYKSHEFHATTITGENSIAYCKNSINASDVKFTKVIYNSQNKKKNLINNKKKIYIKNYLNISEKKIIKCIPVILNNNLKKNEIWLLIIKLYHQLNETKINKIFKFKKYRFANKKEILKWFNSSKKFIGPINIKKSIKLLIDYSIHIMNNFICGANKNNYFYINVNWNENIKKPIIKDIRNVITGDISYNYKDKLIINNSIEIGHIFQLGTIYSKLMNATYINNLDQKKFLYMGCYGIGITRILSAIIEQNFDKKGIIWPISVSPFNIVLCPINYKTNININYYTNKLYNKLLLIGIDAILDDRECSIGYMLSDWELIGIPHYIIIGKNFLKKNKIDYKNRLNLKKIISIKKEKILNFIKKIIN